MGNPKETLRLKVLGREITQLCLSCKIAPIDLFGGDMTLKQAFLIRH